jgi:hypothetical protein
MQTIEEIKKDLFTNWRDGLGYIQIYKPTHGKGNPDNNNQNTFDGYSYFFLKKLNAINEEDIKRCENLLAAHATRDKDENPIPGLFNRHPRSHAETKDGDEVSHDEYMGICAIAHASGNERVLKEIVARGYKTGFIYNNHDPENKNPLDNLRYTRQGVNIAFMQALVGDRPTIWNQLWFVASVLFTALKGPKDTDGKQMAMVKLGLMEDTSHLFWFTHWVWKLIMKRKYKKFLVNGKNFGPMESVFRHYFTNQDHPLSKLARMYDEKFM